MESNMVITELFSKNKKIKGEDIKFFYIKVVYCINEELKVLEVPISKTKIQSYTVSKMENNIIIYTALRKRINVLKYNVNIKTDIDFNKSRAKILNAIRTYLFGNSDIFNADAVWRIGNVKC